MSWKAKDEVHLDQPPEILEINGRLMLLDQRYPSSTRGIIKCLEIVSCSLIFMKINYKKIENKICYPSLGLLLSGSSPHRNLSTCS